MDIYTFLKCLDLRERERERENVKCNGNLRANLHHCLAQHICFECQYLLKIIDKEAVLPPEAEKAELADCS